MTEKSDVYSAFGAYHSIVMNCLDEEIMYWHGDEQSKALDLLDLAMSCTQVAFQARPSMREVASTLMRIDDEYNK